LTTLDSSFCVSALEEALATHGRPDIFNTDQGAQYTDREFTKLLKNHGIKISMDRYYRFLEISLPRGDNSWSVLK